MDGRAGGEAQADAHLGGDDAGERGFAEAGRAVEQDVVELLVARLGGGDGDLERVLGRFLPDEVNELGRP